MVSVNLHQRLSPAPSQGIKTEKLDQGLRSSKNKAEKHTGWVIFLRSGEKFSEVIDDGQVESNEILRLGRVWELQT